MALSSQLCCPVMPRTKTFKTVDWDQVNLDLWAECVKVRARYRSEVSGKEGRQIGGSYSLQAHHILGKSGRLRFDLDNGICLTNAEHGLGVHRADRTETYRARIIRVIGKERWERINALKWGRGLNDSILINLYLKQQLEHYRGLLKAQTGAVLGR
jgi:hypothetical protein